MSNFSIVKAIKMVTLWPFRVVFQFVKPKTFSEFCFSNFVWYLTGSNVFCYNNYDVYMCFHTYIAFEKYSAICFTEFFILLFENKCFWNCTRHSHKNSDK